jgi:energy-coupling factor transporter ATP-binding protein EcfA2
LRSERPSLRVLDPAAVPSASDERVSEWLKILSKPLPLEGAAAMASTQDGGVLVARQLGARAPWLSQLADIVERNTRLQLALGRPWLRLDPLLLVGPAGAGKSHWARMLAQIAACGHGEIDLGGSSDSKGLDGTNRGWGNAYPSWPAVVIARSGCANPILVVEEVDKAGGSDRNGRAHDALLAMLEPSSAAAYPDSCFQAGIDLSQVSWVATANSIDGLPKPLLSRFHIVRVDGPSAEHADVIMEVIAGQLAMEWGVPANALPKLPPVVRAALVNVLKRHRSTRAAKRLLKAAFATLLQTRPTTRPG